MNSEEFFAALEPTYSLYCRTCHGESPCAETGNFSQPGGVLCEIWTEVECLTCHSKQWWTKRIVNGRRL